jgi:hypothetical protein
MAGPAEEAPGAVSPAASPRDGVTEETASPAAAARSRGFWLLGEDKSVHKALGGGKSTDLSLFLLSFCYYSSSLLGLLQLGILAFLRFRIAHELNSCRVLDADAFRTIS